MAKPRLASSSSSCSTPVSGAASSSQSDAKRSINLRIDTSALQIVDDAAALLGITRTEFMVESARRQAVDVLLEQRLFTLDPDRYDSFVQTLDSSPAPGEKLRALLGRTPQWAKQR